MDQSIGDALIYGRKWAAAFRDQRVTSESLSDPIFPAPDSWEFSRSFWRSELYRAKVPGAVSWDEIALALCREALLSLNEFRFVDVVQ